MFVCTEATVTSNLYSHLATLGKSALPGPTESPAQPPSLVQYSRKAKPRLRKRRVTGGACTEEKGSVGSKAASTEKVPRRRSSRRTEMTEQTRFSSSREV